MTDKLNRKQVKLVIELCFWELQPRWFGILFFEGVIFECQRISIAALQRH